jgi:hypothetical protein
VTQLDVRLKGPPPCTPEDLIKEARRRQKRRIRVIAISAIIFAVLVVATVVGLAGNGGGGRSGSRHVQGPASHPHGSGPSAKHTTSSGSHAATAAPPPTGVPPLCIGNGLTIPPGAFACRVMGIHPDAQASEPWGWTFGVTNAYGGIFEGRYITVYAGSTLALDPSGKTAHGVPDGSGVRVTVDEAQTFQQFLLPGSLAPLTVTSVNGDIVTLQLPDGATVTFNLDTDTYS